jgi:multidrug efflux pump subunit AcrA (membrane-fusion protein)
MDCRVNISSSYAVSAMLVPRDAVLRRSNRDVIFTVVDNRAVMIPVELLGYTGILAGVNSSELKDGMMVVTRGYERLSNGQAVAISGL